ncbi:MAG: hypothetical protein GX051_01480 [Clostridiales bacterium]|nr:hypothetical protein [Clostridiales bacterium]
MKGKIEAIKLRYLLFVFAGGLLVVLPLRVYQMLTIVESATGFYSEKNATVYIMYILLAALSAVFILGAYLSREVPAPAITNGKNIILGVVSCLFAAALMYDAVNVASDTVKAILDMSTFSIRTLFSSRHGEFTLILQVIFAFFSAIYFVFCGTAEITGKMKTIQNYKVLALAPLGWSMCRIVHRFMRAISYLNVSELLFEILMLVFFMLFFINLARVSSKVSEAGNMWGIFGYGLSAASFAALVSVPRLILIVLGKSEELVSQSPFEPADLAAAIFAVVFVLAAMGIGYQSVASEAAVDNEADALPEPDVE